MAADGGEAARLLRALPPEVADVMLPTGRRMGAEEAHRWGLATEVTGPGEVLDAKRKPRWVGR
ncbi:enoyl-CoA hydratase-related protein [Streptomyces sp. NPDC057253]|uniref:enoyl-CoA hydratase-related protein n=1 Tax=Streptomyces sp. NPDC057253 TaxID=3346069 RepID=UPI00363B1103